MARNNETVAGIAREMRGPYYKMGRSNASLDKQMMDYMSFMADRIEPAHNRELAAKDDERLTIVAMYENVIADKDAKIAELRKCLKEAILASRIDCGICNRDCTMKMSLADGTIHNCERIIQWRKALEGAKDEGK